MNRLTPKSLASCLLWGALAVCVGGAQASPAENAQQAVKAGGRASGNASASAAHSLVATGQLVSGVLAVPVLASGASAVGAGGSAVRAGASLMDAASRPIGAPLPITDETLSIVPPDQALRRQTAPAN